MRNSPNGLRILGGGFEHGCRDYHSNQRSIAAEHRHGQEQDRRFEREHVRMDESHVVRVKEATDTRPGRAQRQGDDFRRVDRHSRHRRRQFVIRQRTQFQPEPARDNAASKHERNKRAGESRIEV